MSTDRAWFDRVATVYQEREDGRIVMIPLEAPAHTSVLGQVWKGDDFDKDRNYVRVSAAEVDRLTGAASQEQELKP